MKDPRPIAVADAIAQLERFDAILDARSPGEFAEDHIPGAISTPVLSDEQRARVGTLYKQQGSFEAKRIGAAIVSRNIADLLDGPLADVGRQWRPLVYCWRGGNRSGSLATVLARVGWQACVLEGGYREFRRHVIADLAALPAGLRFVVVTGRTGSGKSLLLERLARRGAQVLDLERLARHRGSVLGHLPGEKQPSQKRFETLLWERLRRFDPARPVFVESESRKVGQCQVPEQLILRMRASACVVIEADDTVRAALLLGEYEHFVAQPQRLEDRLAALVPLHGHARIGEWMGLAQAGNWTDFVTTLLHDHYDPAYDRSIHRNFARAAEAPVVRLRGADDDSLEAAARDLLAVAPA
ncbi:MAG TPA: tRNA 2-selenouridine(34) synthase MnmH [Quisquiliibacterium sp.]|nr:tRNA 2-selenouridine(34) synthase MnmH [Quisquiliibacterium sp.]